MCSFSKITKSVVINLKSETPMRFHQSLDDVDIFENSERDKYMKKSWGDRKIYQIYKNSVFESSKADIWRYCILYEKGG